MNKFFKITAAVLLLISCLTGCSFDDVTPEYPTKSMHFVYQDYKRDIVVGEGLKFKVGVVFAGLPECDRDRAVKYQIDPSLVGKGQTLLPADYYTCESDDQIVVKKGQLKGYMQVTIDSAKFVADPKALTGEYVLPVRIFDADADLITENKDYTVISLKYKGKQFGNYRYSGERTAAGVEAEKYSNNNSETSSVRVLETVGADTFRMVADQFGTNDPAKGKYSFLIKAPIFGSGEVTITADPESPVAVVQAGECRYDIDPADRDKKTFTLRYKYTIDGVEYTADDRMVFRNRLRDDQGDGRVIDEYQGF